MRPRLISLYLCIFGVTACLHACSPREGVRSQKPQTISGLSNAATFESIDNSEDRSEALFDEMFKVIGHPRCMNCHSSDAHPRQGDNLQIHEPMVVRGLSDFGAPGLTCDSCHSDRNVAYLSAEGSIPGHEVWMMAPLSMAWVGKKKLEICEQLKDPSRNGGRSLQDIQEHHAEDGLVGWGWKPGVGREAVPGTQEIFGALTQAWIESGAHCPQ